MARSSCTQAHSAQGKHFRRRILGEKTKQMITRRRRPSQPSATSSLLQRTQTLRVSQAMPITPPQSAGRRGSYQCLVDYSREPFLITWSGSPNYPDLTRFPILEQDVEGSSVDQSSAVATIWRYSDAVDYGSYASIRLTKHGRLPIIKLAHSNELSIKLIEHEYNALVKLSKLGLPVVQFDRKPILDNGVIIGYRMEVLSKVAPSKLRSRCDEVKQALDQFHSAGFSHGDLGPSNIMQNDRGRLIFIDVSFSGPIGGKVPSFYPSWVYHDGLYGIDSDLKRFTEYIMPI